MNDERTPTPQPSIHIGGPVSGSIIVQGSNNTVRQQIATPAEEADLSRSIAELRAKVESLVPADQKSEAIAQVAAIEAATKGDRPEVSKLASARAWFLKHLPALAGSVMSVVVHPLVGKLVEAAGDAAAKAMFSEMKQ